MTQSAIQALKILRDPSQFKWYVVPLLLVVIYIYMVEVEKKNWKAILAGLSFWGMDWFNEIWNALVFHLTGYSPVWGAPGSTAYLILIGLNIEICLMFLVMGIVATKILPEDKNLKIFGINNRLFYAITNSVLCVIVEMILNLGGWLTWDYPWWSFSMPFFIFLVGYLPFFVVCYKVYDIIDTRTQIMAVGGILLFDLLCIIVFGLMLGWL